MQLPIFYFRLGQRCAYDLVRFRLNKYLVRVMKRLCFVVLIPIVVDIKSEVLNSLEVPLKITRSLLINVETRSWTAVTGLAAFSSVGRPVTFTNVNLSLICRNVKATLCKFFNHSDCTGSLTGWMLSLSPVPPLVLVRKSSTGLPFSSVGRACVSCAEALQRTCVRLPAWGIPLLRVTPSLSPCFLSSLQLFYQ